MSAALSMLSRMAPRFSDSEGLYSYLLGFVNVERGQATDFKLDRMLELCSKLGNPQQYCRTIHVAGSKGKGSVSTMIARMIQAGGHRVGLYTSPHMLSWKERMSLAGDEMPDDYILRAADEVLPLVEGKGPEDFPGGELPTFFELTTLIAFCAFRDSGCDRAVIETGLGGRLDSTNVVAPAASVITPIELEHTEYLGDTIPLIAAEKAGIIKPGASCYIAKQRPEALEVFAKVAAERGSRLRDVAELVALGDISVGREGTRATIDLSAAAKGNRSLASRLGAPLRAGTPMIGSIQAENMALALLTALETESELSVEAALAGLERAYLPARFQILRSDSPIVLDGAHTVASTRLALESFEALFPGPKALLFACAEDKKHADIAKTLAPRFDRITLTSPGSFKKTDLGALEASFRAAGAAFTTLPSYAEAIARAREEAAALRQPLLVTGSFYLCAEFLKAYPEMRG